MLIVFDLGPLKGAGPELLPSALRRDPPVRADPAGTIPVAGIPPATMPSPCDEPLVLTGGVVAAEPAAANFFPLSASLVEGPGLGRRICLVEPPVLTNEIDSVLVPLRMISTLTGFGLGGT